MTFEDLWEIALMQRTCDPIDCGASRMRILAEAFMQDKARDDRFSRALARCGADKILIDMLKTSSTSSRPPEYANMEREIFDDLHEDVRPDR